MNLPSFLCGGVVFMLAYAVASTSEGRNLAKRAATFIKQDLERTAPPTTEDAPAATNAPTATVSETTTAPATPARAPKDEYNAEH